MTASASPDPPRARKRRRVHREAPAAPVPASAPASLDLVTIARHCARHLRAARVLVSPHLRRALAVGNRMLVALLASLWRNRVAAFRISHRLMWWTALVVLLVAGRALLGAGDEPWLDQIHLHFAIGLALCLVVLAFAVERRLRFAAFLLGAGHGAFGLVVWLVSAP